MKHAPTGSFRSVLFVPATRLDRVAKAFEAGADAVVIDLEDGIGPGDRAGARRAVADTIRTPAAGPLILRINNLHAPDGPADLAQIAAIGAGAVAIMLPKAQSRVEVDILAAHLQPGQQIVPLVETVRGLRAAPDLAAHPAVGAIAFGGADFSAELGTTLAWAPMLHARASLVAAAAEAGVACWDVPSLSIGEIETLRSETLRVRDLGFSGKLAIHPSQVTTINDIFTPTAEAVAQAERIVSAFDKAGGGAVRLDGQMIDLPVIRSARRTLARKLMTEDTP